MNFFVLQDKAKKQTRFLVFLFLLAVIAITFTVNLVFYFALNLQTTMPMSGENWFTQPYWLYITGGTFGLIICVSFWRSWQLKSTPDAIAKMVNASEVSLSSTNKQERMLINVVEEMSIASGMPIPKLYIMREEQGINAFVAGLEPSKVTLVVTQGLLDSLNRQELQGVIAHEYSHVSHGDMRINVRLIGILAGILIIGQIGGVLLRGGSYSRYSTSRALSSSSRSSNSKNSGGFLAIGLGLFVIGYIGLFFGRMIKAAISRQREFLADASAVQFTRDKDGIAGALYKISLHSNRSLLQNPKAEEMSHMCFGESVKQGFSSLLATHPPINERIKAINPNFAIRQKYKQTESSQSAEENPLQKDSSHQFEQAGMSGFNNHSVNNKGFNNIDDALNTQTSTESSASTMSSAKVSTQVIMASIGGISAKQLDLAKMLLASLPKNLVNMAHAMPDVSHCYRIIELMLLANQNRTNNSSHAESSTSSNAESLSIMQTNESEKNEALIEQLQSLNFQQQHCLLDIALARIEQQPKAANTVFVAKLARQVSMDVNVSLTEFMIYASAVKRALTSDKKQTVVNRFKAIEKDMVLFFAVLYQQSKLPEIEKQNAFEKQLKLFGLDSAQCSNINKPLFNHDTEHHLELSIPALSQALNSIAGLNPLLRGDFIQACIEIVNNDGEINQTEYELLRVLGEYLDAPLPLNENIS
jgi:Zn-dependent protease with chaperone function/uncharacterized tellurite resistance protein B-like protein